VRHYPGAEILVFLAYVPLVLGLRFPRLGYSTDKKGTRPQLWRGGGWNLDARQSSFVYLIFSTTFEDERLWVMWTITSHDLHQCALVQAGLSFGCSKNLADNVFVPAKCQLSVRFAVLRSLILNALRPHCDWIVLATLATCGLEVA
jgi:hypothetical protein